MLDFIRSLFFPCKKHKSYIQKRKKPYFQGLHAIPSGGLTPGQVCKAYGFQKLTPVRKVTIGIVSLDGVYSDSDMRTAFAAYNLPVPLVTAVGPQSPDFKSTIENMLDIECAGAAYAFCTGQPAVILEQFKTNDGTGITKAINALVNAGCEVISISWGGPADEQVGAQIRARAQACAAAANANVHIFAASGDNSLDDGTNSRTSDDPCCDPNVWGVGGTRLSLNPDGTIASESAWGDGDAHDNGGGGGFDPDEPIPSYQQGIVPGNLRGSPDSSANADPQSGYAIVANGQWQVVGGTSASTPLTAGYVAAILSTLPNRISPSQLKSLLYNNRTRAFNDITLGSNGDPAVPGWDDATGCGSINGAGMAAVLTGR
ncbi:MAG: S8 family serine peptidase [Saprospiraceae bacterium]